MATIIKDFNSDEVSKQLLASITSGLDFNIPNVDLSEPEYNIPKDILDSVKNYRPSVTIDDLTSTNVDGPGVFDKLMTATKKHLQEEYKIGRITGAEYTNAYISMMNTVLQVSVQFTLNKDKAQLEALLGAINAYTSIISNATAKVALATAQAQAHTQRAQYANTVAQLAVVDTQYAISKENMEAARAQTSETKSDGSPIEGTAKRNNELLETQRNSFIIKDKTNFFKFYMDWAITAKTQDIGMATPDGLQNEEITKVLNSLKTAVGL